MNGIIINVDPVIVHVGALAVRWYGLAVAGGVALAMVLVLREAKWRGLDTGKVGNVALWAVVGGIVGARLFHVVDRLDYYLDNPWQVPMVNQGGLAIWGGIIGGGLVALLAARREGLPTVALADATAIGLLAAQMVGRLGCIVNGDAYGGPTTLPWGFVYINPGAMVPEGLRGISTHPYPLYEIVWDVALLGLLLFLRRRRLPGGLLFLTYVAGYAIGRFTLTFVRQEAVWFWGLQEAQVIALIALLLAVGGAGYVMKRGSTLPAQLPRTDEAARGRRSRRVP